MTMHQILKSNECISFLTVSVERGEIFHTRKSANGAILKISMVQSPSTFLISPAIITLPNHRYFTHQKTLLTRGSIGPGNN